MRGSNRRVMVVLSRVSALSTAPLIRRTSIRVSAQNAASSSSVSKRGISVQRVMTFTGCCGEKDRVDYGLEILLRVLALVERALFRGHAPGEDDAVTFPVGPKDREDAVIG